MRRAGLAGGACWLGYPMLDPIGGLVIAVFIAHTGWEIARDTSRILSDRVVIAEDDIRRVVMSVPGVLGCHQIRSRGSADHAFLDLHVWYPRDDAAARGAPAVARREGSADGDVPADRRRDHPHRAAARILTGCSSSARSFARAASSLQLAA